MAVQSWYIYFIPLSAVKILPIMTYFVLNLAISGYGGIMFRY